MESAQKDQLKGWAVAFGIGFAACFAVLWVPQNDTLMQVREGREEEINYIKTRLLGPDQIEKLNDWEEEGTSLGIERRRHDERIGPQPPQ